jgi:hypothetical protein
MRATFPDFAALPAAHRAILAVYFLMVPADHQRGFTHCHSALAQHKAASCNPYERSDMPAIIPGFRGLTGRSSEFTNLRR